MLELLLLYFLFFMKFTWKLNVAKNATISEKTIAEQLLLLQELEGFDGVSMSIFLKICNKECNLTKTLIGSSGLSLVTL